jgi:hypothetical protein
MIALGHRARLPAAPRRMRARPRARPALSTPHPFGRPARPPRSPFLPSAPGHEYQPESTLPHRHVTWVFEVNGACESAQRRAAGLRRPSPARASRYCSQSRGRQPVIYDEAPAPVDRVTRSRRRAAQSHRALIRIGDVRVTDAARPIIEGAQPSRLVLPLPPAAVNHNTERRLSCIEKRPFKLKLAVATDKHRRRRDANLADRPKPKPTSRPCCSQTTRADLAADAREAGLPPLAGEPAPAPADDRAGTTLARELATTACSCPVQASRAGP